MKSSQPPLLEGISEGVRFQALEEEVYGVGFHCVAGLDEVGRGPLAGPVVAAAVVLPRGFSHPDIRDSKQLTARQREALVPVIKEQAAWSLGVADVGEIDRINILHASLLAMARAVRGLQPVPDFLLIDGNREISRKLLEAAGIEESRPMDQRTLVQGDRRCLSIAAASIVAKVARDEMMADFDKIYPGYGFARHKGYGSRAHLASLASLGPSPIHRRSFRPVREACSVEKPAETAPLFAGE